VINRSFAAPMQRLFELWTDPSHLPQWLPPAGFDMEILHAEIHEGGECFFRMTNHADISFYGKFEYVEVKPSDRIVYIQRFCDQQGQESRHPALPVFPAAMRTTIQFTAEDSHTTRVTVTSEPVGAVSAEELSGFIDTRAGMTLGWTCSFDQLEAIA
jgi:uncharacterized protein YndB with AHSA1/START domain